MTLYQAYVVLKHHSDWREGRRVDMVKADKLTQALEIILNHLDKKLTKESNATI
jgi:hypothetical protein